MKRALLAAGILALSTLTACTAIVLGKLGDTKDYTAGDADIDTTSSSSSSGSTIDGSPVGACSLLASADNPGAAAAPDNPCSECIQNSCADEVSYACNGGGANVKPWFDAVLGCAQNPYHPYAPLEAGVGQIDSWECTNYEDAGPPTLDNGSDTQHQQAMKICIDTNCMHSDQPACNQCVVSIEKDPGEGDFVYLSNDSCGRCFDKCPQTIVECCNTQVMKDIVSACAFTNSASNKQTCQQLGAANALDASDTSSLSLEYGSDCLNKLVACYNSFCKDTSLYTCEQ